MEDKEKTSFDIAGISFEISSSNSQFIEEIKLKYQKFITNKSGKYRIEAHILNDSFGIDSPYVCKTLYGYDIFLKGVKGKFNCKSRKIILSCLLDYFLFDSFLRILLSIILSKNNGFLLHSCGINKNGKGFVFFGEEGAGKTTIAEKFERNKILSDDLVVVKVVGSKVVLFGTPFSSRGYGNNLSVQCREMFYLEKSKKNRIVFFPKKEAFKKLLSCILFFTDDIILCKSIFKTVDILMNKVVVKKLCFTKEMREKELWEIKNGK